MENLCWRPHGHSGNPTGGRESGTGILQWILNLTRSIKRWIMLTGTPHSRAIACFCLAKNKPLLPWCWDSTQTSDRFQFQSVKLKWRNTHHGWSQWKKWCYLMWSLSSILGVFIAPIWDNSHLGSAGCNCGVFFNFLSMKLCNICLQWSWPWPPWTVFFGDCYLSHLV